MAKGQLLAEGLYQWFGGEASIGRETWQISQLGHGGIVITSRGEFTSPSPWSWNYSYELDRAWAPLSVSIRLDRGEQSRSSTQRVAGDRWVAQVETDGDTLSYELPFSSQHEVDFRSPLFNTVTLLRTRLQVGANRDLDVIYIAADSLVPTPDRQRYECLAEEKEQVPAGNFPALKYRMTHPDREGARVNEIWADHHGIVLDYQSQNGVLEEWKLARYRRIERR